MRRSRVARTQDWVCEARASSTRFEKTIFLSYRKTQSETWIPTVSGGDLEEATPDPIPNSEVKLLGADGTAREAVWESRTPPGLSFKRLEPLAGSGLLPFCLPKRDNASPAIGIERLASLAFSISTWGAKASTLPPTPLEWLLIPRAYSRASPSEPKVGRPQQLARPQPPSR